MNTQDYLLELMFSKLALKIIVRVLDNVDSDTLNEPIGYVDDTYLICLAKRNSIELARYFTLRPGVEVDTRNSSSYKDTALSWAVFQGHSEIVKILISAKADVNMCTRISGKNLYYWAYSQRQYGIFKLLMSSGATLTSQDYYGQSIVDRLPEDSVYLDLLRSYKGVLKKVLHTYLYHRAFHYERSIVKMILTYYPGSV